MTSLVLALLLATSASVAPRPACSVPEPLCRCMSAPTAAEAFGQSGSVVLGRVVSGRVRGQWIDYEIKVHERWKGRADSIAVFTTYGGGASCGRPLPLDRTVLLYGDAREDDDRSYFSLCTRAVWSDGFDEERAALDQLSSAE